MFKEIIEGGENKNLQFIKEVLNATEASAISHIAETSVAFSNRAGGLIVIGVDSNRNILGINEDLVDSIINNISNYIHEMVTPMILTEIYTNRIEDKIVIVVKIFPGPNTPYYIKAYGKIKGTFIRVGKINMQADIEMIKELERLKLNISYDEDNSREADATDINELCKLLTEHMHKKIDIEQLYTLKLIKSYGNIEYLTNAALIILGKMPNSRIRCATFSDDEGITFSYKKEFEGNIFEQLHNAESFCKNTNIPILALREGIVNALIHRDYAITTSDIRIAIYKSRIEIVSPGYLLKSITLEEILAGTGRSESRNNIIARIIKECGLMDQWGSGINRMITLCKEAGLIPPVISEEGLFVRVIFYNKKSDEVDLKNTNSNNIIVNNSSLNGKSNFGKISARNQFNIIKKKDLTEEEKKLIEDMIYSNPKATVKIISDELGISIASVKRRLKKLQMNKIIERVGSNKSGYWKINKRN